MRWTKRTFLLLCFLSLLLLSLTACEDLSKKEETKNPTEAPQIEEAYVGEPCLSPEAKKKYQFAEPVPGETVAELVIENYGSIFVKFFPGKTPKAVENFLEHAKDGYYDNTLFFRVMKDFMIQGGDPESLGFGGESIFGGPFEDEFDEELSLLRGALCMANSGSNSNKSQFFLVQAGKESVKNLSDMVEYQGLSFQQYLQLAYGTVMSEETLLDYYEYGGTPWLQNHHTVFGQMFDGFEVLDAIAGVEVSEKNRPVEDVILKTIRVYTY